MPLICWAWWAKKEEGGGGVGHESYNFWPIFHAHKKEPLFPYLSAQSSTIIFLKKKFAYMETIKPIQRMEERVPNHQRWSAKWKLSWNAYTLHTRFCMF